MYKRILVPLDGSEFSEEIIPCAVGLSAIWDIPLVLLRIAPEGADQTAVQGYLDRLAARHDAESLCLVNDGDIVDTILQETERVPDTLVAMTSHGRSGLLEVVIGSVAKEVVRRCGMPVLLWHPGGKGVAAPTAIKTVVLPLDGKPLSEAMGPHAAQFAKWLGAELLVVRVIDPKDVKTAAGERGTSGLGVMVSSYVRTHATTLAAEYGVSANWETLHGENPAEAIAQYLSGSSEVLLVMATRGQKAMKTAFLGSVAGALLSKGGVPMLIEAPGDS